MDTTMGKPGLAGDQIYFLSDQEPEFRFHLRGLNVNIRFGRPEEIGGYFGRILFGFSIFYPQKK